MKDWIQSRTNSVSIEHALRTTAAAMLSFLSARGLGLPEAHWAPISSLVVMQSSWADSLPVSVQRFAGTAVGALVGALVSLYWPDSSIAFGSSVLALGILAALTHVNRAAYRYAGITVAIVVLIPHPTAGAWVPAFDRFTEVSLGIAVGLAASLVWPERKGT